MFSAFGGGGVPRCVLGDTEITSILDQHWPNCRAVILSLVRSCTTNVQNDILEATCMGNVSRKFADSLRRTHQLISASVAVAEQLVVAEHGKGVKRVTASQWDELGCSKKLHSLNAIKQIVHRAMVQDEDKEVSTDIVR